MEAQDEQDEQDEQTWQLLPLDLRLLGQLHSQLPPAPVRFRSVPGQAFLRELRAVDATGRYNTRKLAVALDVAPQTIIAMKKRRFLRDPPLWPKDSELRDLRAAWRVAVMISRPSVRRQDPQFAPVHEALMALLDQGFAVPEIALAVPMSPRRLRTFLHPPLPSPAELARAIQAAFPRQGTDASKHHPRQGT